MAATSSPASVAAWPTSSPESRRTWNNRCTNSINPRCSSNPAAPAAPRRSCRSRTSPTGRSSSLIPDAHRSPAPPPLPELGELDVVRHYTNLSTLNMSIDANFYPLGSCTMKYNPKRNERLAALPGFAAQHPYQDESTLQGLLAILFDLQEILAEIAGLDAVSLQPAAGAQGELTALLVAAAYFRDRGEQRTQVLIPDSAHGTNPASAHLAGFEAVTIKSDSRGLVDLDDFQAKLERPDGRLHDDQPQHGRPLRPPDRRDRPAAPRPRGPALPRRRQHERDPRHRPAGRHGRRPDALQPAQDLLRPARRRRPGRRPDRRPRATWPPTCPRRSSLATTTARIASTTTGPSRSAGCGRSSATPASSFRAYCYIRSQGPDGLKAVAAARGPERELPDVAGQGRLPGPLSASRCMHEFVASARLDRPASAASGPWTSPSG